MLPLRLFWEWTVWKSQGQTLKNKVVVSLTSSEREHGLTYIALSRVTKFSDIGILDGVDENRLLTKVRNHSKMAARIQAEERFCQLEVCTLEFLRNSASIVPVTFFGPSRGVLI